MTSTSHYVTQGRRVATLNLMILPGLLALCASAQGLQSKPSRHHATSIQKIAEKQTIARTPREPEPVLNVSYHDGLLSIFSQSAALSDILQQIHEQIGVTIIAPVGLTDAITVQLGPALPAVVVTELFQGTRFDYLIAASPSAPLALATLVVTMQNQQPDTFVAAKLSAPADPPVEERTQTVANLTGGDEGSPDAVEVGTPVTASPAGTEQVRTPAVPK